MECAFVCENEMFFNWTGSVFALMDTNCSLHKFVEETTLQHLESWPSNEKSHIRNFVDHNIPTLPYNKPGAMELYGLYCSCPDCRNVYDRLMKLKTSPQKPLQLKTPSVNSKDWWILLKMFLPKGDKNVESLEKCDVAAFCSLLERCQLFDEIDNTILDEIISIRNKLMHTSSNELSSAEKRKYLNSFEKLLSFPSLRNRLEIEDIVRKIRSDKLRLHHFVSALDEFEEIRGAFDIQERAIKRDLEIFKEWQLDRPGLEKLLEKVQENQVSISELIATKGKLIGTIEQAVQMGKREGANTLGSDFVGSLTGGAGAYVAGRYKQSSKFNN